MLITPVELSYVPAPVTEMDALARAFVKYRFVNSVTLAVLRSAIFAFNATLAVVA